MTHAHPSSADSTPSRGGGVGPPRLSPCGGSRSSQEQFPICTPDVEKKEGVRRREVEETLPSPGPFGPRDSFQRPIHFAGSYGE